jgi:hypothetical protein
MDAGAHTFLLAQAQPPPSALWALQDILLDVRIGSETLFQPGVYYPGGILGGVPPD